jgi:uncharacterized protein YlxP (DUF503 family)
MVIGFLSLDFHFPHSRSLKDKRREVAGIRDRLRQRYNVSVAELDFQDTWQRSRIGVAALNSRPSVVQDLLGRIRADVLEHTSGELLDSEIRLY